eukprot:COSAG06_NODE_56514_length_284_cov_0.913514_1_plen_58_part_01
MQREEREGYRRAQRHLGDAPTTNKAKDTGQKQLADELHRLPIPMLLLVISNQEAEHAV